MAADDDEWALQHQRQQGLETDASRAPEICMYIFYLLFQSTNIYL